MINDSEDRCKSHLFYLPHDSPIYEQIENIGNSYLAFFYYFIIVGGPICLVLNVFLMFILTRKQLWSPYNFVFLMMVFDQGLAILGRFLIMGSVDFPHDCDTPTGMLIWILLGMLVPNVNNVLAAHVSWLAVIITYVRLKSLRQRGMEPSVRLMIGLCAVAFILLGIVSIPQFMLLEIHWFPNPRFCDDKWINDEVPHVYESDVLYAQDCLLLRVNYFAIAMIYYALPCIALIVVSSLLLLRLHNIRKNRMEIVASAASSSESHRSSIMLITIVVCTLITDIPQVVANILVMGMSDKFRSAVAGILGWVLVTLVALASACNLAIHLLMSRQFRETAMTYLCFICSHAGRLNKKHDLKRRNTLFTSAKFSINVDNVRIQC